MSDSTPPYLCHALRLADPATADALAERMRPEVLAALADRLGLPEDAVETMTRWESSGRRRAMTEDVGEFLLRAVGTGDPEIARVLYVERYRRVPWVLSAILAAADPADARWYAENGLVPCVLKDADGLALEPALRGPFPELVRHAVVRLGRELPLPVVLDACRHLAGLSGAAGIEKLADGVEASGDELCHPGLAELLRAAAAAPDPAGRIRESRPAGEWTDPAHALALLRVRLGEREVEQPAGLGWDLIRREHDRRPLATWSAREQRYVPCLSVLVGWEGCPDALIMESFRDRPGVVAGTGAPLPFEAVAGLWNDPRWRHPGELVRPGIRAGRLPVDRVLNELTPAREVLDMLPYDHEPTRKAVADLLAPLGTDPVNWLTFYARMGRADGTAVDLVADAVSTTSRKKRNTTWPRRLDAVFPVTAPGESRAPFLQVLQCVSEAAQLALVPHLDARAVQHFLVYGDPAPAVREAIVAAHGVPALASCASSRRLPAAEVERLLDLDEPAVDANVFLHCSIDQPERERLLAGRLRGGGTRAAVPQELLDALDEINLGHYRHWVIAGLESGDLGVARKVVGRLRLQVPAARLRLLIAVWERGGPDAVREILAMDRLPATLRRRTEKLLDAPDGLERMRALLADEESPVALTGQPFQKLLGDGIPIPWPAMADALRDGRLPDGAARTLSAVAGCPREIQVAALRTTPVPQLPRHRRSDTWPQKALAHGTLTVEDVLTHAAPARAALDHLVHAVTSSPPSPDRQALRALITALTEDHLGGNVEAWAVCLQLLPTFAGTLTELISTAGAVAQA
ncbi:hypothetical protein [Streptomyces sp. NPDC053427]|uniref:hypothetical protein n=1 Tax=Streptomyces sp. NPDC053427 TaxID=3365701 RepID=UPI0037CF3439